MGPPSPNKAAFKSRTNSSVGLKSQNGEMLAVMHPKQSSGMSSPMAMSATSTARASFKDPNEKQPMMAYDPNALRK